MMKDRSSGETGGAGSGGASRLIPLRILAACLGAMSLVLMIGGAWLLALGGSAYYLLAGLAIGGSAALLWRGRREGAEIYAILLVLTVAWALWESGLDGWALAPRLITLFVLGGWLLLPWPQRGLQLSASSRVRSLSAIGRPVGLVSALFGAEVLGVMLHSLQPPRIDPALVNVAESAPLQADATTASNYALCRG